jgi:hypothetical protein
MFQIGLLYDGWNLSISCVYPRILSVDEKTMPVVYGFHSILCLISMCALFVVHAQIKENVWCSSFSTLGTNEVRLHMSFDGSMKRR